MKKNNAIFMPSDRGITGIGVKHEILKGSNIPLSKYKIIDIYWEEVFYP